MAKSTRARGATFTPEELADPQPPVVIRRAMLGGEPLSVGTTFSERLSSESPSSENETPNPQERAQTTESHLLQTDTGDSDVSLTDGSGQTETVRPYDEWTVEELKEECRERELPVSGNKHELVERLTDDDEMQESEEDETFD